MEKDWKSTSQELLYRPMVLESGFIDPSEGVAVTTVEAMKVLNEEKTTKSKKRAADFCLQETRAYIAGDAVDRRKAEVERHIVKTILFRTTHYGDRLEFPHPLRLSQEDAKEVRVAEQNFMG